MISVIIPVYNEAAHLPATLAAVKAAPEPHEVIVVDASSNDDTPSLAASCGAQLLSCVRRQRASQMNIGARHSTGDTFLFLHADTLLPPSALMKVNQVLRDPQVVGGAFARRFQSSSIFLRLTCMLAEMRSRCAGWFLGDQAMFVRRKVFEELGGFRDLDLFEDLDFARRLRTRGQVVTLRPPVFSSGRRFERLGPIPTTCADFFLTVDYICGIEPNLLAKRHRI